MTVTEDEVAEEYERSLAELTCNSKPQINMLTMLAEENENFASKIVQIIETRILQVANDKKLPILYLIDSIVKNCPNTSYKVLFSKKLVDIFLHVFEKGDEKTRSLLYRLRSTWNDHFQKSKLYNIDIKVNAIDRNWPIANTTLGKSKEGVIHVNPKFINSNAVTTSGNTNVIDTDAKKYQQNSATFTQQPLQKPVSSGGQLNIGRTSTVMMPSSDENVHTSSSAPKDPRRKPSSMGAGGQPSSHYERLVIDSVLPSSQESPQKSQNRKPTSMTVTVKIPPPSSSNDKKAPQPVSPQEKPKPVSSVVTKVAAQQQPTMPKVVVDSGSWKMDVPKESPPSDLKINKIPPGHAGTSRKTDVVQSSVIDRDRRSHNESISSNKDNNNYNKSQRAPGAISGNYQQYGRGGGGGGGRGRSAGTGPTAGARETMPARKYVDEKEHTEKSPINMPKRLRSRSPSLESSPTKAKREKVTPTTKSRRGEGDYGESSSVRKTPTKDSGSGNSRQQEFQQQTTSSSLKQQNRPVSSSSSSSFVLPAVDTDMRNTNSTDSDRSSKDVDLRTLPFKKRKRSDDGSTSADTGYPSDQGGRSPKDVVKQLPSSVKTKKRAVKSEAILDEILFGGNEDHDERLKQQRPPPSTTSGKFQQRRTTNAETSTASGSSSNVLHKDNKSRSLPAPRISVDAPQLPNDSVDSLVEYRTNIFQRAEQQMAEGKLSRQEYNDIVDNMSHLPERPNPPSQQQHPPPALSYSKRGGRSTTGPYRKPRTDPVGGSSSYGKSSLPPFNKNQQPPIRNERPYPSRNNRDPRPPPLSGGYNKQRPPPVPQPQSDTSLPDAIPVNNKIIVDGQSYEVYYVNDIAVIEQNGLPHRLYFAGPGREVIIDGVPYRLKFDESRDVLIDGQMHNIRFGGPSRELYMGNFPFRGSFGGPPIFATINGVKHKIQLTGPAPEVKIDPEPSPELARGFPGGYGGQVGGGFFAPPASTGQRSQVRHPTLLPTPVAPIQPTAPSPILPPQLFGQPPVPPPQLRFPPQATLPMPSVMPQPPPPQQQQQPAATVNVNDLLNKLLTTGIISLPSKDAAGTVQQPQHPSPVVPVVVNPSASTRIELTSTSDDLRMREPVPALKEFNEKALKIRYSSVIEALYQERTQCSVCGMRFLERDQQKYSKHLDWHFKQKRLEKMSARSISRSWYFASEDWVKYEEFGDENAVKAKSVVFEPAQTQADEINRFIVASTDSVIPASNRDDQNECAVCNEKFVQFWDEDEETWKMRNAMLVGEKAYHPLCYQDVSRDFASPAFGSPTNTEKPMFWTCTETAIASLPSSSSESPATTNSSEQKQPLKRNASTDRDLMLQSVLSVVCNVPSNLVNTVVNANTVTTSVSFSSVDDAVDMKPPSFSTRSLLPGNNSSTSCGVVNNMINVVKNNVDDKSLLFKNVVVDNDDDDDDDDDNKSNVVTNATSSMTSGSTEDTDIDPAALLLMQTCRSATVVVKSEGGHVGESGESGGTTPVRDERPDSPGTPVHDETSCY